MKILLDPRTLLEYLVHRNDKFEYLSEILKFDSSVQLYLSEPGLARVVSQIKPSIFKNSEKLIQILKRRIKILRLTKIAVRKARLPCAIDIDYELAIEIHLAIRANIGAIVTHRPNDFPIEELSILTLREFHKRKKLEINILKTTRELPAVWGVPLEQIENLNKILYHLPSYIGVKLLEPKESNSQLNLTSSSDKVFTPSTDKLSPQSTNARSLEQIIANILSNQFAHTRSTASSSRLDMSIPSIEPRHARSTASSSRLDMSIPSIEPRHARSTASSSLVDLSIPSIEPRHARSTAQANVVKNNSLIPENLAYKSYFDTLRESISHRDQVLPQPQVARSLAQLEAMRFSSLAAERLTHTSSLDTLKESIDRANQIDPISKVKHSFSDRSGILSQIESIESMQKANTLESYLPRKNSRIDPISKVEYSFSDRSGILSQIKSIESMQKVNTLESYLPRKN